MVRLSSVEVRLTARSVANAGERSVSELLSPRAPSVLLSLRGSKTTELDKSMFLKGKMGFVLSSSVGGVDGAHQLL
jgi:hypothetical protein